MKSKDGVETHARASLNPVRQNLHDQKDHRREGGWSYVWFFWVFGFVVCADYKGIKGYTVYYKVGGVRGMGGSLQPSDVKRKPRGFNILMVLLAAEGVLDFISGLDVVAFYFGNWEEIIASNARNIVFGGLALSLFSLSLGLATLVVVYGLYFADRWSRNAAFAIPLLSLLLYVGFEVYDILLELRVDARTTLVYIVIHGVWLVIVWYYLGRKDVKQYLSGSVVKKDAIVTVIAPPPAAPVSETTPSKKYCRYCGFENKSDAVFCEKCGRQIT